jgi:hypothetical protein
VTQQKKVRKALFLADVAPDPIVLSQTTEKSISQKKKETKKRHWD